MYILNKFWSVHIQCIRKLCFLTSSLVTVNNFLSVYIYWTDVSNPEL